MEEKDKRTNTNLGQLQAQERGVCVTLFPAALRAFVDYRGRVFCAKLPQRPLAMLTSVDCVLLLLLTTLSSRLCPSLDCYLKPTGLLCPSLSNPLSYFSRTFLPSSTSGLGGRSRPQALCVGFTPKQTKRSSLCGANINENELLCIVSQFYLVIFSAKYA